MRRDRYEKEQLLKQRKAERKAARKAEKRAEKRRDNPDKTKPGTFLRGFTKFWGLLYILLLLTLECLLIIVNVLPPVYLIVTIVVLTILSLLILPRLLFRNATKRSKIVCIVISLILMVVYSVGIIYLADTLGFLNKIFGNDVSAKNVDVTDTPFNVLISGNDNFGEIEDDARSDVNMLMTVNPNTHKILLTSIPRDYYVTFPDKNAKDKLTHSGIYGIEETIKTVEKLLDTQVNYYMKLDFDAAIELVDAIDGITVNSEYEFSTSGRENEGYYFVEGENHLNGEQALAFCRERYSFENGDLQRGKNQQLVLEAILNKVTSSSVILTNYVSILNAVGKYMKTNMPPDSITDLVQMQMQDMQSWQIEKTALKGTPDSAASFSMDGAWVSVVMPDDQSVKETQRKIKETMDLPVDDDNDSSSGDNNW